MHGQHVIYGYNACSVIIVVSLYMRVDLLDNEKFNLCQLEPVFSIVYVVGSRGDS